MNDKVLRRLPENRSSAQAEAYLTACSQDGHRGKTGREEAEGSGWWSSGHVRPCSISNMGQVTR